MRYEQIVETLLSLSLCTLEASASEATVKQKVAEKEKEPNITADRDCKYGNMMDKGVWDLKLTERVRERERRASSSSFSKSRNMLRLRFRKTSTRVALRMKVDRVESE